MYAVNDVAIHTESDRVNKTNLTSPFPDFYKPAWFEIFETVARQTKSSWKYDPRRDYWVFGELPLPLPYQIQMLSGWKVHGEGLYVGYKPKSAPVGMDVYMMGRYSADDKKDEPKLFARVREALALRFAAGFKSNYREGKRPGVPDEAHPRITLTLPNEEHLEAEKWANVKDRNFDQLYERLLKLVEQAAKTRPYKSQKYDDQGNFP